MSLFVILFDTACVLEGQDTGDSIWRPMLKAGMLDIVFNNLKVCITDVGIIFVERAFQGQVFPQYPLARHSNIKGGTLWEKKWRSY